MQNTKQELIRELQKQIKNWKDTSENYYNCSKREMKDFLADIKVGHYDKMLNAAYYYSLPSLIAWHKLRLKRQTQKMKISPITIENYKVFQEVKRILTHITNLIEDNTYTSKYQTPPTEEELKQILAMYQKVVMTNYSFDEAELVKKRVKNLHIYDSSRFPHNIEELSQAFFPQIKKQSVKYEKSPLITEIEKVQETVGEIKTTIVKKDIQEIFKTPPKTKEECYVRRMILSQIDIPALVYENYILFFKPAIDMISTALSQRLTLTEDEQELLWKDTYMRKTTILPLIMGVLKTLETQEEKLDIKEELQKIQKENHCSGKTVTRPYQNMIMVNKNDFIYSIPPEEIPILYQNLQTKYDELYEEASNYEFVEGCIEIMGELMISQIFLEGNKRTGKCLFNKMLVSRKILPPVVDLNEEEANLWDLFVDSRSLAYQKAKEQILEKTKEQATQFREGYYDNPVTISPSAISRRDFYSKYYRR